MYPTMRAVLFLMFSSLISAECPRLVPEGARPPAGGPPTVGPPSRGPPGGYHDQPSISAPSSSPVESYIQTTFMHNDKSEEERLFSRDVQRVIDMLRKRLGAQLRVNIDNENIDCSKGEHVRCNEYLLNNPFHLLFIEDSSNGAGVYSVDPKLNKKSETIEMALLDALSRHSLHDLTSYCSEAATREVGFVRRVTDEELVRLSRKRKSIPTKIVSRSALETNLIDQSILELRSFNEIEHWHELENFDKKSLKTAIDSDGYTFVLFWSNVDTVSQHAFYLWAKSSEGLKRRFNNVKFGAVACHNDIQLCDDNEISKIDLHTIFALKDGKKYAKMKDFRDEKYYIDWVTLLVTGPLIELKTEENVRNAKKGIIEPFEERRPAITIGFFKSTNEYSFEVFEKVAEILKGRYHFAYNIKQGSSATVITVRANEKTKRRDFSGNFDVETLIHFVTHASLPSVLDISEGFTTDLIINQNHPIVLLITSANEVPPAFVDYCAKDPSYICIKIIREQCPSLRTLLREIKTDDSETPKLIIFKKNFIHVAEMKVDVKEAELREKIGAASNADPIRTIGPKDVHPLRYVQLAHINHLFGEQPVTLLPEPQIAVSHFHHDREDLDEESYGGCPVMSKIHRMKDEL